MTVQNTLSSKFEEYLLSLNKVGANSLIQNEFTGQNAYQLIQDIMMPALEHIGAGWEEGTIALSQEYMASNICEEIVNELLPPESSKRKNMPVLGVATLGDQHMLGKQIVVSCLKSSGFNIFDYGAMPLEDVVVRVQEDGIEVLLVSTLMLNFAYEVKNLRDRFNEEGVGINIVVGGAPFLFDTELWKQVGADAMAVDATEALSKVYELMGLLQ
jgi:methanogenic corrinoid protein MtbC1